MMRTANPVYLGVDLGTTSTKVAAFDHTGRQIALASHGYPLETPEPGAAEQDPQLVLEAVLRGLREVVSEVGAPSVAVIAYSAAMHSVLALDEHDQPLTRALTWADARPHRWAERVRHIEGGFSIAARTGTPPYAMSPLSKIRWIHEELPDVASRAARYVSLKEYVVHALHGMWVVDHSMASATGLFNLHTRDWDEEALALARVRREQLSPLVPTTWRLPALRWEVARDLGLDAEVPAVIGANDGALANLGSGAVRPGVAAISLGTSGAIRVTVGAPATEPSARTFCYVLTENLWVVGGPVNNGALVLRWARDAFTPLEVARARETGGDTYVAALELAATAPPGAKGLLFLPYLLGERAPLWSTGARGAFVGVSVEHQREHFIRAALEGVCLNLALVLNLLEGRIPAPHTLRASGGFARSALWRQLLSDVIGRPLEIPESVEASCLGAVLLARHALGELPDLTAVEGLVGVSARHDPDEAAHAVYRELLPLFARLGERMLDDFRALAEFQRAQGAPDDDRDLPY